MPMFKFDPSSRLFLPTILSRPDASESIKKAGIACYCSHEMIFGSPKSIRDVEEIVSRYDSTSVIQFVTRLLRWLSHNDVLPISRDKVQADILQSAIEAGRKLGLNVTRSFFKTPNSERFVLSHEICFGLLSIALATKIKGGTKTASEDCPMICYAITVLADLVGSGALPSDPESKAALILKADLTQMSMKSGLSQFNEKMGRFDRVHNTAISKMDDETRQMINQLLQESHGVRFNELRSLVLTLNSLWLNNANYNSDILLSPSSITLPEGRRILEQFLKKNSLTLEQLHDQVLSEQRNSRTGYYKSKTFMKNLVRFPFVNLGDGRFMIVSPSTLVRHIELSVLTAFLEGKSKETPVQTLLDPLGKAFEQYCGELLARVYTPSTETISSAFEISPKGQNKDEITDVLLHTQECSILFECKHKQPPLDALDLDDTESPILSNWVKKVLLEERKGRPPGALVQLSKGIDKLEKGERQFPPKTSIPIVVLKDDFVFTQAWYSMIDPLVNTNPSLLKSKSTKPYLIMSASDLDYLTSLDFYSRNTSLNDVIFLKSTNADFRNMSWQNFLRDEMKLKAKVTLDSKQAFNDLLKAASEILPSE